MLLCDLYSFIYLCRMVFLVTIIYLFIGDEFVLEKVIAILIVVLGSHIWIGNYAAYYTVDYQCGIS